MRFLDQVDIAGKRLLIRVDYNVPIKNGVVQDDLRIRESLPTLRLALSKGAALVLCSHFGKAKGKPVPELSLKPVAEHLSKLLDMPVALAPDCVGPEAEAMAKALEPGQILLLENLRFHAGEEANDPEFSAALAAMGEVYVDDAFGVSHRAHASVVGVTTHFKDCCAGLLLQKEWQFLGEALTEPARPYFAVSGGAKVSTKLGVIKRLLTSVDGLVIGGAMANTFLLAMGYGIGKSLAEANLIDEAKAIMDEAEKRGLELLLPVDVVVGKGLDDAEALATVDVKSIPAESMVLDIGPRTRELYAKALRPARTILWNGPMGAFENPAFAEGSIAVAKAIAAVEDATTIVGGGDTDSLIHKAHLEGKFTFISTGGGSTMEFLEGKVLPAFAALEACAK